jgi:hypothetical protein
MDDEPYSLSDRRQGSFAFVRLSAGMYHVAAGRARMGTARRARQPSDWSVSGPMTSQGVSGLLLWHQAPRRHQRGPLDSDDNGDAPIPLQTSRADQVAARVLLRCGRGYNTSQAATPVELIGPSPTKTGRYKVLRVCSAGRITCAATLACAARCCLPAPSPGNQVRPGGRRTPIRALRQQFPGDPSAQFTLIPRPRVPGQDTWTASWTAMRSARRGRPLHRYRPATASLDFQASLWTRADKRRGVFLFRDPHLSPPRRSIRSALEDAGGYREAVRVEPPRSSLSGTRCG